MLAEVQGRLQQNIAVLRQAQATGSQPKPTQRQQGGYITWVGGRMSAAYCQLVGNYTWGTEARSRHLHSSV